MRVLGKSIVRSVLPASVYDFVRARVWVRRARSYSFSEPELAVVPIVVGQGDNCLDIGAYAGDYAAEMARACRPTGTVQAFEPLPRYSRLLRHVIRNLKLDVKIHEIALGEDDGEAKLVFRSEQGHDLVGEVHLAANGDSGAAVNVRVRALDSLVASGEIPSRIQLIKIDVEGAELSVLRGASSLLDSSRPVVICEIEDRHTSRYGHSKAEVINHMADCGFVAYHWSQASQAVVPYDSQNVQNNVVFVHPANWPEGLAEANGRAQPDLSR